MERNKSINLRNIVIEGKVVKGKFLKVRPTEIGTGYYASFELVLPKTTIDNQIRNYIVITETVIDKTLLNILLSQSSKKLDITISENPIEGTIDITNIRITKDDILDISELLNSTKLNEVKEAFNYDMYSKEVVNRMVVKGKFVSAFPAARGTGYRASFDLLLPKITKDKQVINDIVTAEVLISKPELEDLLDTLRKQSSKILDITVSQNLSGTFVMIEKVEVPNTLDMMEEKETQNTLENDKSEILKFIKLDEILESTLKGVSELEDKLLANKVDMLQIIELISVSREFGLLIGDIEENIKYTLESCKDFTRKIDNLLCDIDRLQSDSKLNIAFYSALLSFSSKLVSLKFNITLLMEKILLSQ